SILERFPRVAAFRRATPRRRWASASGRGMHWTRRALCASAVLRALLARSDRVPLGFVPVALCARSPPSSICSTPAILTAQGGNPESYSTESPTQRRNGGAVQE